MSDFLGGGSLPDRLPPQSLDAEQSTLGACLISRTAVDTVLQRLTEDDFYLPAHRKVYAVIAQLAEADQPVDMLSVPEALKGRGWLEAVGGISYISTLENSVPTAAHAEFYAQLVREKSLLRQLIDLCGEGSAWAYAGDEEAEVLLDRVEQRLFGLRRSTGKDEFVPLREPVFEALETVERLRELGQELTGLPTGLPSLDVLTHGLQRSDLIIVAGRPSMGKTALALGFAAAAGAYAQAAGGAVALFSLEMSKLQVAQRLIAMDGQLDAGRLRTGRLSGQTDDWSKLGRAAGRLGDLPFYVNDASDLSVLDMRAKLRRLHARTGGLQLIVIDYLQLIRGHGKNENRNQELGVIARLLKGMAKEFDCPVLALSQLSRAVERREDKRPLLSDLRESGSIEAEADLVLFPFRAAYYKHGDERPDPTQVEEAELIIAKHRNGAVGSAQAGFIARYAKFVPLDDYHAGYEPPAYDDEYA